MRESINTESTNDTETGYASVEDTLNMLKTAWNETTLASAIPNIINVIIASGQGKKQFQFQAINFVRRKHFLIFFLRVNLVNISWSSS